MTARGILCNRLVCLALWTSARIAGDAAKCIVLAWLLLAFVAAGFEHSVANMTSLAIDLLGPTPAISMAGTLRHLFWVSTGNVAGATLFVVGGYLLASRSERREPVPSRDRLRAPLRTRPDAHLLGTGATTTRLNAGRSSASLNR
ncbi:formate/nitrite transporter family protein [Variovorax saccharolyticus]|uniref:formate/nitrite transporter family protein n=1 Tax=Variovorax saccharolyticus TaxID=3053516 RepID=UPI00336A7395